MHGVAVLSAAKTVVALEKSRLSLCVGCKCDFGGGKRSPHYVIQYHTRQVERNAQLARRKEGRAALNKYHSNGDCYITPPGRRIAM